jgi:hypothetical protein
MTRPQHVIWRQFLDGGHVIDAAWRDALTVGGFVGTCPCGSYLRPGRPFPAGRYRTGYTAVCSGCDHEYGALGPSDAPAKIGKETRS